MITNQTNVAGIHTNSRNCHGVVSHARSPTNCKQGERVPFIQVMQMKFILCTVLFKLSMPVFPADCMTHMQGFYQTLSPHL